MLRDRTSMTGPTGASTHLGIMLAAWRAVGKDMPFALSIGHDPVIPFIAGMPLTTKAVFNCLPIESWTSQSRPVRASFDTVYRAELRQRILRDWTRVYRLPE